MLSSGAILRSDNEAELAGLLSYAMGHAQTGRVNRPSQWNGSTIPLIFLGGPWGVCERWADENSRSVLSTHQAALASLIESQADVLGLGYMVNGGYDPQSLVSVFTHWSGKLRPEEDLRAKSDSLTRSATRAKLNTSAFDQMKARLAPSAASRHKHPTLYQ